MSQTIKPSKRLHANRFIMILISLSSTIGNSSIPIIIMRSYNISLMRLHQAKPMRNLNHIRRHMSILSRLLQLTTNAVPMFSSSILIRKSILNISSTIIPSTRLLTLNLSMFVCIISRTNRHVVQYHTNSMLLFNRHLRLTMIIRTNTSRMLINTRIPMFHNRCTIMFIGRHLMRLRNLQIKSIRLIKVLPT